MAPPAVFKPEMADQAYKLCLAGFTDDELSDFFGVHVRTIYRWKTDFSDFAEAISSGRHFASAEVSHSLFRRAMGYDYEAQKVIRDPKSKEYTTVPYTAHMPPDTIACIFWLKNKQPDKWRDVRQHEVGRPGEFQNLTDEELRKKAAEEAEALGYTDMAQKLREGIKLIDVSPETIDAEAVEVEVEAGPVG